MAIIHGVLFCAFSKEMRPLNITDYMIGRNSIWMQANLNETKSCTQAKFIFENFKFYSQICLELLCSIVLQTTSFLPMFSGLLLCLLIREIFISDRHLPLISWQSNSSIDTQWFQSFFSKLFCFELLREFISISSYYWPILLLDKGGPRIMGSVK